MIKEINVGKYLEMSWIYYIFAALNNQINRNSDTMGQNDYLRFSEDGKTLIRCQKDYKGKVIIPLVVQSTF